MVLLKRDSSTAEHYRAAAGDTARQLQAHSKYLAHLAAAEGYRTAANSDKLMRQTRSYIRRHPLAVFGVVIGIISALGLGLYRRNRY